ncbi:MAG: hypothetical protein HY292_15035 [Planctomycetes bacterium]|nr:hypothetical protein [Planctomycetota bacterium]
MAQRRTGLLRGYWIALVLALVTVGHVYSFRISLPGRFPRDVLPHVVAGFVAVLLAFVLSQVFVIGAVVRRELEGHWRFAPRHWALGIGALAILASGIGLMIVRRSGTGTTDISAPPLELTLALAHFFGMITLLVGSFRTLRKDFLD